MKGSLGLKLNKSIIAVIIGLAWPTMLEQLMQTAVQYIDTAMVGVLGTEATAAVGSTGTVSWLVSIITASIGVGFLAYIAKSCGAGDIESARKATAQSITVTLVVGLLLTAIVLTLSPWVPVWMQVDENIRELSEKYFFILYLPMLFRTAISIFGMVLRAAGDTKTPMVIGIAINIINVALNFLLIYPTRVVKLFGIEFVLWGAGKGVLGAAAASALAFTAGGITITIALIHHKKISPKGFSLKPDASVLRPCFKIALPNLFQGIATSLGYVVFASMINSVGETATAACTIANTVESAFYIPGFGMKTAASTLAGNAYGAKDNKKMKELTRMFIPIEIFLMIISGAALFIFAPALVGLFSKSDEVINLGATVLRMVALSEPFYGFSIIIEGFLVGVGKTKTPFIYTLIGMWGVRIVGTFILINIMGYGLVAAWGAMIAHNMLLFVLYLICYLRGNWNPLNNQLKSQPLELVGK